MFGIGLFYEIAEKLGKYIKQFCRDLRHQWMSPLGVYDGVGKPSTGYPSRFPKSGTGKLTWLR